MSEETTLFENADGDSSRPAPGLGKRGRELVDQARHELGKHWRSASAVQAARALNAGR